VAVVLLQGADDGAGLYPEHDIFIQLMKLKNTLRWMRGEDLITHLGLEYYD
jgi:myo-inositol-1-phosphate synthase